MSETGLMRSAPRSPARTSHFRIEKPKAREKVSESGQSPTPASDQTLSRIWASWPAPSIGVEGSAAAAAPAAARSQTHLQMTATKKAAKASFPEPELWTPTKLRLCW